MRFLALPLVVAGCVVPWFEPDEGLVVDTDTTQETDDTEVDTEETDDTVVGDGVELSDDCPGADDLPLITDGAYDGAFRGLTPSGLDPKCSAIGALTGQDGYRRVRVKKGEKITVELIANKVGDERDVAITLLSACAFDQCVRGADGSVKGGKETLVWTNEDDGPADLILGVHLFDTEQTGGDFDLTVARE